MTTVWLPPAGPTAADLTGEAGGDSGLLLLEARGFETRPGDRLRGNADELPFAMWLCIRDLTWPGPVVDTLSACFGLLECIFDSWLVFEAVSSDERGATRCFPFDYMRPQSQVQQHDLRDKEPAGAECRANRGITMIRHKVGFFVHTIHCGIPTKATRVMAYY